MRKKKWATPLLTVLVRGKPEERVLCACKSTSLSGSGDTQSLCKVLSPACSICETQAAS